MIKILLPESSYDSGKRPECLKKGLVEEAVLNFNSEWCRAYFILSGDTNDEIHSDVGAGIVQGTAILTKIGTTISQYMSGFMVIRIVGDIKFKNPVKIGNLVNMTMERLDNKEKVTRVKVSLELVNGEPILSTIEIILCRYKKTD